MNLKFKSTPADLKFNIQSDLKILNGNILYLTHEIDQIKKLLISLENSSGLQKQVDDYFQETSPQTEPVEQNDAYKDNL